MKNVICLEMNGQIEFREHKSWKIYRKNGQWHASKIEPVGGSRLSLEETKTFTTKDVSLQLEELRSRNKNVHNNKTLLTGINTNSTSKT